MFLLAQEAISRADAITIIVLCVVIAVFLLLDIILVFSLHNRNKKLAEPDAKQTQEQTVKEECISSTLQTEEKE